MTDKQVRGKYTQEFKLEAVRQVKAGQSGTVAANVLGIPKASLTNWVRQAARGQLSQGTDGSKPAQVTPEQMEIARLRAEVARLKMERDIAKKRPRRTLRRTSCKARLDPRDEGALARHPDVRSPRGQSQRVLRLACGTA